MKYMKYLATLALAAFTFASCETDVERVQLLPADQVEAPVLDAQSDIIVNGDNVNVEAVTFTCSEVDFGQPVAVSYKLYFEKDGVEAFIAESNYPAITVEKADLNGKVVNNLGVEANTSATINAYIIAYAGASDLCTEKSNVIAFTIQTFKAAMRKYHLCGVFNGWDAGNAVEIWENKGGSNVYEALVHLPEDATNTPGMSGFKVLPNRAWDGGEMGFGNFSQTGSKFESSSDGNLLLPAGIWLITIDLNNMAIDAKEYSQVDIMGGFDGWAAPLVLEYDAVANVWKTPSAIDAGQEYKLRLNNSWDINYGDGTKASEIYPDGFELVQGAGNILTPVKGVICLHANCTPWVVTYQAE